MPSIRDEMITRLLAEIDKPRLILAMATVFANRREKSGLSRAFRADNAEKLLTQFLQSLNVRQLEIFRQMAEQTTVEVDPSPGKAEQEEAEPKVDIITEVVKPPTAH